MLFGAFLLFDFCLACYLTYGSCLNCFLTYFCCLAHDLAYCCCLVFGLACCKCFINWVIQIQIIIDQQYVSSYNVFFDFFCSSYSFCFSCFFCSSYFSCAGDSLLGSFFNGSYKNFLMVYCLWNQSNLWHPTNWPEEQHYLLLYKYYMSSRLSFFRLGIDMSRDFRNWVQSNKIRIYNKFYQPVNLKL